MKLRKLLFQLLIENSEERLTDGQLERMIEVVGNSLPVEQEEEGEEGEEDGEEDGDEEDGGEEDTVGEEAMEEGGDEGSWQLGEWRFTWYLFINLFPYGQ